jgi:two-component system cell cycle response regulator
VALANASANALYNAFLYEHLDREKTMLEKLAITDYLTGIYNVRYFYNRLEEEFSRAERYQLPLSCIMFDIDYFKNINDTFGHRIGDIVLREFAQLVRSYTRKSDIFARYGGEEFIMLLPQTEQKGAIIEAERIRKAVVEHPFHAKEANIRITLSAGIASLPNNRIKNYDELIHSADTAMFEAKQKGRNSVVVYSSQ